MPKEIGEHNEALSAIIVAARQQVETDCCIVCYTGTFTWRVTDFSRRDWLELPDMRPITAITSIAYPASDGTSTTLLASYYNLETSAINQFVRLTYGNSWPDVRGDINGVLVTFVAGYATVAAIPQLVKQAVLLNTLIRWLQSREVDTEKYELAYERQVRLIKRETYS